MTLVHPILLNSHARETRQGFIVFARLLVDLRDAVQKEIARGATEDQAAVNLS